MTPKFRPPLKSSASLWSADLSKIGEEIKRVDDYVDLYHIDVSDGTYADQLLFFPDLVAAVRPYTEKPIEVHLITQRPERWISSFSAAGTNRVIFYPHATSDPEQLIGQMRDKGLGVGISLAVEQAPEIVHKWLAMLDCIVVMGTAVDIKGVNDLAPGTCEKIRRLVDLRTKAEVNFEIEADGAIRRHTVPQLRLAGADIVVPGSLMFKGEPAETARWIQAL